MFSQWLLQIIALVPGDSPVLIVVVAAGLVFLGGHYLMRARERSSIVVPRRATSAEDSPEARARVALRRSPVPVLVTDADSSVPPVAGYVITRSTDGVVIELEEEGQVDPGTHLRVRPIAASEMIPWVLIVVERRDKQKSCWHLECSYVRTPPYSIRMLFG